MNYNSNLANVLEDKNLLYVFAKNAHVKMPKRFLACQEGIFTDTNNKTVSLAEAISSVANIGECFAKPSIGTDSGRGCEVYCFMDGKDRKTGKRRLYRRDSRKTEYGTPGIWNKGFYTGQRSSRKESEIL